ncbi:hypothetical protein B9Z55_002111 [Caenorhabditis nigoni]|uniref:TM2 domain-containing protein n=1 Tax=Caenorhabditis nigoni TaxID=1611254 RepID=A0A2G5VJC0_9PELO|nr:hypothetical protein B9Z55_002111 [Caenorhabditis nigoni]
MTNEEDVKPWVVRIILIVGGILGAHRLYLKQVPEAFVFFSTLGVFLIGWLYDSFMFKYEVDAYNQLINLNRENKDKEKWKNGRLQTAQSKFVEFSLTRFLYSVLYGLYIGIGTWLACTLTFGWTDINSIPFVSVVALGITAGVYIIGHCGGQSRELSFIWISSFSSMFLVVNRYLICFNRSKILQVRVFHSAVFRSIFIASIVSTLVGNRTAKNKRSRHTWRHFLFWSSLFMMLVCVILLGCSRKIGEKQITATRPGSFRETTSVGSLMRDRIFDSKKVYSFFEGNPIIEYSISDSSQTEKSTKSKKSDSFWQQVWSGELFDELTGAAHLTKIDWVELTMTFIVDVLRAEARVIDKSSTVEPFKWALWRNYLIHRFSLDPLVSDDRIRSECKKWQQEQNQKRESSEKDFSMIAAKRGCATFQS